MPTPAKPSEGNVGPVKVPGAVSAERADLERLRSVLWDALEAADVAVKAQVAGQLQKVIATLAALGEPVREVSIADEIAARREARRTPPADRETPGARSQPRRRGGSNRTG